MTISAEKLAEIREVIAANPSAMTLQLARHLEVPECEIIRAMPGGRSVELDVGRWQEIFESFAELGSVTVIVSNGAVTCEVNGEFGAFSTWGEFFNVQTPTLDLHIRYEQLGSVFAVEKPGHLDGGRTLSVQFYDGRGDSALKVFLNFGGRPNAEREAWFMAAREQYRKV